MLLHKFDKEPGYNPDALLDGLIERLQLKNDAALSRLLRVQPPIISKVRRRRAPVTAALLLRMHETAGVSTGALRRMLGVSQLC